MKRKKLLPALPIDSLIPYLNLIWGILALGLWSWEQYAHAQKGTPFSWVVFAKGALILSEAVILYQLSNLKGFYFLGMFPLSWLAVSRFQWNLCFMPEYRYWLWLALFLASEILILALPNGKKLLFPLVLIWTALLWIFKFSFLLPLTFLTAPSKRFQQVGWVRWGGLAAGVALYLVFKGWTYFQFAWLDLYDLFAEEGFLAFFLLGWLGLAAFDRTWKGTFRHMMFPLFLLTAGFVFWGGRNLVTLFELEILQWILVLMAGFGWEAFRKYLMDPSWHGRAVWFALGLAFFGGIL